jgi:hypothetical protein
MYANASKLTLEEVEREEEEVWFATKPISIDDLRNKSEQDLQEGVTGGLVVAVESKEYIHGIFSDNILDALKNSWTDYKDEGIMIGGKNGRIISGYTVQRGKKHHIRDIDIPIEEKHLNISYSEDAIALDEFNQILSTFKFINQY